VEEQFRRVAKLRRDGWRDALSDQQTWLNVHVTASNANMVSLALLSICLLGDRKSGHEARAGLESIRRSTHGWWNAGLCACHLLATPNRGMASLLGEVRVTLHAMPEEEIPPRDAERYNTGRIATIRERGVVDWAWKTQADKVQAPRPGTPPDPTRTYTRADWLFAYWLTRAAGHLTPTSGPGSRPTEHACPVEVPPWHAERPSATR
jgi:hypothetical protein